MNNGYVGRETMRRFTREYKDVPLPDGTKARIQNANNREKEEVQAALVGPDGKPNFNAAIIGQSARLIVRFQVDGEGKRIYSDDDVAFIQDEADPDIVGALAEAIIEHTGINESGIERLKKRFGETAG